MWYPVLMGNKWLIQCSGCKAELRMSHCPSQETSETAECNAIDRGWRSFGVFQWLCPNCVRRAVQV